ncbi:MAG: DUF116 domain-containing protein [bacterium]|nr:DUF116 domain-containing protein [bacterium]
MKFREIDTGLLTAAENMAWDQALLEVQSEIPSPTLRFLAFSPNCALVGYFQAVEQEIREDYCGEKGIEINRRITGGGAIFFDPSQVGWELIAPVELFPYSSEELYRRVGSAVADGLKNLGINAEFKKRNDIEVNGRKISGMGGINYCGAFLFQGTLLVEDKLEEMLYSLRVPIEKLKPKEIDSVRERVTCIERELNKVPSKEEIKEAIKKGFEKNLGVEFVSGKLRKEEQDRFIKLKEYYKSDEWIYKIKLPKESQGLIKGTFRSENGTTNVNLVVNAKQNALRSTYITGDFFIEKRELVFDLERILKNIPMNKEKILQKIDEFLTDASCQKSDLKGAFIEAFKKWSWVKTGFTPEEANNIYSVNFIIGDDFNPKVFLFPYCSKDVDCEFRRLPDCPQCGKCSVGDGYKMAIDENMECITIITFEDLMEKFEILKKRGITEYIGSCCEAFYVKHQEEFRNSGLKGLLVNIENSTCYDLGKAKEAYLGRFENRTDLNLNLIRKVLMYLKNDLKQD